MEAKMNISRFLAISLIALAASSCAQLPKDYKAPQTTALDVSQTTDTKLAKILVDRYGADDKQTKIFPIFEGTDALFARAYLAHLAERTLDVQYYIWHKDLVGQVLLGYLLKAADRGVRVRLLIDDMPNQELDEYMYALDRHENFEVRLFNPFTSRKHRIADFVSSPMRINRRMHNKTFTADNVMTIVGGRNIGNEYFSAALESNFKDADVLSAGPVVQEVSASFDTYWNSSVVYPVRAFKANQASDDDLIKARTALKAFRASQENSDYASDIEASTLYKNFTTGKHEHIYQGNAKFVFDDPQKALGKSKNEIVYLSSMVRPYRENIKEYLEILSPYFVPGKKGVAHLAELVKKGVKVRVITNSLASTDGVLAQSGYQKYRLKLLRAGVELYELKSGSYNKELKRAKHSKSGLHAKLYSFDRKAIFIGSFNLDQRSANINTEAGIVYEVPKFALDIINRLDKGKDDKAYKLELITAPPNKDDSFPTEDYRVEWVSQEDGKEVRYTQDPHTTGWNRFVVWFYGILPIESQL